MRRRARRKVMLHRNLTLHEREFIHIIYRGSWIRLPPLIHKGRKP